MEGQCGSTGGLIARGTGACINSKVPMSSSVKTLSAYCFNLAERAETMIMACKVWMSSVDHMKLLIKSLKILQGCIVSSTWSNSSKLKA